MVIVDLRPSGLVRIRNLLIWVHNHDRRVDTSHEHKMVAKSNTHSIGSRYEKKRANGTVMYQIIEVLAGNEYRCIVSDAAKRIAPHPENVHGREFFKMKPSGHASLKTRSRRGKAQVDCAIVTEQTQVPCAIETNYVSDPKGLFRNEIMTQAQYFLQKTGRVPIVAMIDHDENSAIDFFQQTNPKFFEKVEFIVVNYDEIRCGLIREQVKLLPNVRVECGAFADVISSLRLELSVIWADGCARVMQEELSIYMAHLSSDGFLAYTMPTRPITVEATRILVRALNATAGIDEFDTLPYQNGCSTMMHVSCKAPKMSASPKHQGKAVESRRYHITEMEEAAGSCELESKDVIITKAKQLLKMLIEL